MQDRSAHRRLRRAVVIRLRGLLDADMRTLREGLGVGWHWWIDEIVAMLPPRLRRPSGDSWPRLIYRDDRLHPDIGVGSPPPSPSPGMRATIVLPRDACLCREIERPRLNHRDLRRTLALDSDTLFPFLPGIALTTGQVIGPATETGRVKIEIAALPRERATRIAAAVSAAGIVAMRLEMCGPAGSAPPLDFAPAMRDAGLFAAPPNTRALLWASVGILLAVNLAVLIWRDAERVRHLELRVADQQSAVSVARAITRRIVADRAVMAKSIRLRRAHDALGDLALVSAALPVGAWLHRYAWDGETVRLSGYRPAGGDVTRALRRTGRFADVQASGEVQVMPAMPTTGEPFDLSARVSRS